MKRFMGLVCGAAMALLLAPGCATTGTSSGGADVPAGTLGAAKVYRGTGPIRVTVVPLTAKAANGAAQAVLQFQGTGGDFEGKALLCQVLKDGDTTDYQTTYHGRDWTVLSERHRFGGVRDSLAVPGGDGGTVQYDDALSGAAKPDDTYALYQKQSKDGTLAALARFDQAGTRAAEEKDIAKSVDEVKQACGATLTFAVNWQTISDDVLKKYDVANYCSAPLESLARICKTEIGRQTVQQQMKQFTCAFGAKPTLALSNGALAWTTSPDAANLVDFTYAWLGQNVAAPGATPSAAGTSTEVPPWGSAKTLGERMALEKTSVCTDDHGHAVALTTDARGRQHLYYGRDKSFVRVRAQELLAPTDFLDPRFFDKTKNPDFRGADMRVYSSVDIDPAKKSCVLMCGAQKKPLTLLPTDAAEKLLLASTYAPNPQQYVPYKLLRDDHGRYYFIDRGAQPGQEKRYRLFIGRSGALKLAKMTDVVTDSQGQIFSTRSGKLRMVVDVSAPSYWIQGKDKRALRVVPVEQNLQLIYNKLGVYLGKRLGTPCDDQ